MIRYTYEYIYISYYEWSLRVNGAEYPNNYSATLMLTLLILFNLATLVSLFVIYTGWQFSNTTVLKFIVVVSMISIALFNYKYFTFQDRYLKLLEHYRHDDSVSLGSGFFVAFSVLGSLFILFTTWVVGIQT